MSFAPQVNTVGDPEDVFTGNELRFATKVEADAYVVDLAMRWTAVVDVRVVESEDAVNRRIVDGVMEAVI